MQRTDKQQKPTAVAATETSEPVVHVRTAVDVATALHVRLPLEVQDVFVEHDGPQLFTAVDELGRRVLVMNVDEQDGTEISLAAQLPAEHLQAVIDGDCDLRSAFDGTLPAVVQEIRFQADSSTVQIVDGTQIPERYLPESGVTLVRQTQSVVSAASAAHVPTEGWDGEHSLWMELR